ncbi:hypothetical protein D9756_008403 [Leucocoprinus leucothites]|uniref:Septin-type G domain-containing protein n=1 Tax=Leucocoprinus leucothites TaxID=201217 RepID=A0A8H5D022_9AGAR|nr:hypothetical protein D9756_008403 [Leucoagaricus leucothites]
MFLPPFSFRLFNTSFNTRRSSCINFSLVRMQGLQGDSEGWESVNLSMDSPGAEPNRRSKESLSVPSEQTTRAEGRETTEDKGGESSGKENWRKATQDPDDAPSVSFPTLVAPENTSSNNTIGNQRDNELANNPASAPRIWTDMSLRGQAQSERRSAKSKLGTPNVDDENTCDDAGLMANATTHSAESSAEQPSVVNALNTFASSRSTPQRISGLKNTLLRMLSDILLTSRPHIRPPMRVYEPWDFTGISHAAPVGVEDLNEDDMIIVVMGPTGSGKSTFIRTVTGVANYDDNEVGHRLMSATSEISALRITFTNRHNTNLVLVDTPGFNDTNKSDYHVLETIVQWFRRMHERKRDSGANEKPTKLRISGILYLHRITDIRLKGSILKNFEMFQKLCGEKFYDRVVITTTMWPNKDDSGFDPEEEEDCRNRDQQLKEKYWKFMVTSGSRVCSFTGNPESARGIINQVVDAERENQRRLHERIVLIQQEIVNEAKSIPRTRAGRHLHGIMEEKVERQSGILEQLKTELTHSEGHNAEVIEELLSQLRSLQQEKEEAAMDLQKLERHRRWNALMNIFRRD